jgi:hypothetical protein
MPGAEFGAQIWAATHRIENEDGAWESRALGGSFADGATIGGDPDPVEVLIGEGAYEGLVAIFEVTGAVESTCTLEVRGLIFAGAPVAKPYNPG